MNFRTARESRERLRDSEKQFIGLGWGERRYFPQTGAAGAVLMPQERLLFSHIVFPVCEPIWAWNSQEQTGKNVPPT